MRSLSQALKPWMVTGTLLATAALALPQVRSAQVAFTHLGSVEVVAKRVGDEAYVAPDVFRQAGWTPTVTGGRVELRLGDRRAEAALRLIGGERLAPVRSLVRGLGGEADWRRGIDLLEVYSPVRRIRVQGDRVEVAAGLAIRPSVFALQSPDRLGVDLFGARLAPGLTLDLRPGARVRQTDDNVVRLEIDTDGAPEVPIQAVAPSENLAFSITVAQPRLAADPAKTVQDPASAAGAGEVAPTAPPVVPPPAAFWVAAQPPALASSTEREASILVTAASNWPRPIQFRRADPRTLELVLPGVKLELPEGFRLDSPLVSGASVREEDGATILTLQIPRPLGVEVTSAGNRLRVNLLRPRVQGKLSDKTVVVDPGHGGHDPGAIAPDRSVREKDLVLAMGRLISQALREEGAAVIMTRNSDVFIPIPERAAIANRNGADFFVSVHINSNRVVNTASGIKTFYHGPRAVDQALADALHREIVPATGLRDLRIWADTRIHQTGFGVLRRSTMPAVLLELGFINHRVDRARMQTAEFQQGVARAVVRGLKVFLGDE